MPDSLNCDYPLPSDSYVAFDGLTIKEKIRQRLNQTNLFTDQNFEGSNISAINDFMAMIFSLLIFNLNKSANEGQFTSAQLYENMNRIVKEFDYKPVGHQTASLTYSMSATNFAASIYAIPRYSSIAVGNLNYSFNDEFHFTKTVDTTLEVIDTSNELLYQGSFIEYPLYTPAGSDNEIIYLTVDDSVIVDNSNIFVYVKPVNGIWAQWSKTASLFLHNANESVFEIRFNENKHYELKFGNNINGKKLNASDSVAIYYLQSNGSVGEVGASVLQGKKLNIFNTARLTSILNDINQGTDNYVDSSQTANLIFNNSCVSTHYSLPESVDSIRQNAPGVFRNQYSLTTSNSYENFIKSNFSYIVQDVKCMNNSTYLNSYIKYFYNLGLTKPQLESRALFNQNRYADSCNFNNVYLFLVPKTISSNLSYLVPAQKSVILDTIQEEKTLTAEIIPMDPVYIAIDIATSASNTISVEDKDNSVLYIQKSNNSRKSDSSIKQDIQNTIINYFLPNNIKLGQTININDLMNQLLGIGGINKIFTLRTDTGTISEGLRTISWNPIYPDLSVSLLVGNVTLEDFQFPYLFNTNFIDRIVVADSFTNIESII